MFTAYLKNSVTRSVDPLRVIDWRIAACFVDGMVGNRMRYSIDGRRVLISQKRVTHVSKIGCTYAATRVVFGCLPELYYIAKRS